MAESLLVPVLSPCPLLMSASRLFLVTESLQLSTISEKTYQPLFSAGTARQARPNYNYDPDMNNAIFLSETIDDFDRNPALIHELVLRIANPELGHASMDWIRQNRSLVDILLYRHYQQYDGLMLPPTAPAIQAMRSHETAVNSARSAGATPDQLPHISFPSFGPPPDDSVPKAPGQKGKAPVPGSSPSGNPWGSIGDRRRFGGGRGGGASGGGVAI
ncbi:unnamed protein product [Alternaria alternata]